MRTKLVSAAIVAVGLASCANNKPPSEEPVRFKEADAFYTLLNLTQTRYQAYSEKELVDRSTFIGLGKLTDVQEGVEIRDVRAPSPTSLYTLVIKVAVRRTIKGQPDNGSVYFEYVHGGAFSVETYRANLPPDEGLLLLVPAEHPAHPEGAVEYVGEGKGYPADATLYRLNTPQGWFIMKDAVVDQPLETKQLVFMDATTLEEIEQQILSGQLSTELPSDVSAGSGADASSGTAGTGGQ